MSTVGEIASKVNAYQDAAKQEGKQINQEFKADQLLQREWNDASTAAEANKLMKQNLDLQDKMGNERLEVEAFRATARKLEGEAKEKELDSFVGTQLERELETGVDEPIKM